MIFVSLYHLTYFNLIHAVLVYYKTTFFLPYFLR
jgi:hypothetical protein